MNSRIYIGHVMHLRLEPVRHQFRYPIYVYAFDLDELPELDRRLRLFGYNRFNLVSLRDRDYLGGGAGSIRTKLMRFLEQHGCANDIARMELVTSARYFNYVFNPVNFYYCYRADGTLRCITAEVNNTFDETHLYILDRPRTPRPQNIAAYTVPKAFHVSPFNDMKGDYDFHFADLRERLDIRINILRDGEVAFMSRMWGTTQPLTSSNLIRTLMKYPITMTLTMPRILWEATKLHYQKGLPVYDKPIPADPLTIKTAPPTWRQRIGTSVLLKLATRLHTGCLTITLPDGSFRVFGDTESPLQANLRVRNYDFFWRVLKDGDIGLGESYTAGDWEADDLSALIKLLIANQDMVGERHIAWAWFGRMMNWLRYKLHKNTVSGSRRNIRAHYDLSNDFFQTFLDNTMTYSCALFHHAHDTLEEAQKNKLHAIIQKARISSDDHVLEIGSGWGSFAIEAALQTGCRVTTITVSEEQLELVRERVRMAGLESRINVDLCDYRQVEGRFDKIVSVEMLEAVGHEFLGQFFQICDRLLKPHGLVALQVITIPDQRYELYRRSSDWIRKHVFPGGAVPSLTALCEAMTRHSSLIVEHLENIGIHYSRTLSEWRERFDAARERIQQLGFGHEFQRMWEFYLACCEAEFATRNLNVLQLVLTRPNNERRPHHALRWEQSERVGFLSSTAEV